MRKLVLSALYCAVAATSFAQSAPTPSQLLLNDVIRGTAVVDHVVNMEGYDYYIYIDRSVSPPAAAYRLTEASLDKLFAVKPQTRFMKVMRHQDALIGQYVRQIEMDDSPAAEAGTSDVVPTHSSQTESDNSTEDIKACVEFYPESDRGKWHRPNSVTQVHIDNQGRPDQFKAQWWGPVTAAPRQETCQSDVGHFGKWTDVGGHMIGAQLGGWGGRANLVPQNKMLNATGSGWTEMDNAIAFCAQRGYNPFYEIIAAYMSKDSRPDVFTNKLTVTLPTIPPQDKMAAQFTLANEPPTVGQKAALNMSAYTVKTICNGGDPPPCVLAGSCP